MKNIILGIDIGGSKIRSVLWNGKRAVKAREFKTPKNLTEFKKLLKLIMSNSTPSSPSSYAKRRGLGGGVTRIGIAVPGRARGTVFVSATNLPYIRNFNFAKLFPGAKLKISHDAMCFARAEYRDKQTAFFLTLGTGIGRAVGKGGRVLKIKKFEYPERWEKEYQKFRDSRDNKKLAELLGKKLSRIINLYSPQIIIIGGGVSERKGFLAELRKALGLPVQKSKFGKNAVAIGATMLFQ